MTIIYTQIKATLLILLIAGHECARINGPTIDESKVEKQDRKAEKPEETAEDQMRILNKQCSWKLSKLACDGPGCAFSPLPLDKSISHSCRLTSDYMLADSRRDMFIDLEAEVLDSKSLKFKNSCADAQFWDAKAQALCYRRAGHMFHSAKLLIRAEQDSSTKEIKRRPEIDRAIENLANLFGTDANYIIALRQKMGSNALGMAQDLEGSLEAMTDTLKKLLMGNDAEKEEARQHITNMPDGEDVNASEQDVAKVKESVEELAKKLAPNMSETADGWDLIDDSIGHPSSLESEASALLEVQKRADLTTGLVIAVCVILALLLIAWLLPVFAAAFWTLFYVLGAVIVILIIALIVRLFMPNAGNSNAVSGRRSSRRSSGRRSTGRRSSTNRKRGSTGGGASRRRRDPSESRRRDLPSGVRKRSSK